MCSMFEQKVCQLWLNKILKGGHVLNWHNFCNLTPTLLSNCMSGYDMEFEIGRLNLTDA